MYLDIDTLRALSRAPSKFPAWVVAAAVNELLERRAVRHAHPGYGEHTHLDLADTVTIVNEHQAARERF